MNKKWWYYINNTRKIVLLDGCCCHFWKHLIEITFLIVSKEHCSWKSLTKSRKSSKVSRSNVLWKRPPQGSTSKTECLLPEASSWGRQIKLASRRGTSVIVRGWGREKLREIRRRLGRQAFEHGLGQVEFSSCRKSGKTKFTTSSRSRIISTPMKDSTASKV